MQRNEGRSGWPAKRQLSDLNEQCHAQTFVIHHLFLCLQKILMVLQPCLQIEAAWRSLPAVPCSVKLNGGWCHAPGVAEAMEAMCVPQF